MCFYMIIFCLPSLLWHIFGPPSFLSPFFCPLHNKCGHPCPRKTKSVSWPPFSTCSGGLKTKLGKPNAIPIITVLTFWFRMVPFFNGRSEVKCLDFEWWLAWTILQEDFFIFIRLSVQIKHHMPSLFSASSFGIIDLDYYGIGSRTDYPY